MGRTALLKLLRPIEFGEDIIPADCFLGERDIAGDDDLPIHIGKDCCHLGFQHPVEQGFVLKLEGPERHVFAILLDEGFHEVDFLVVAAGGRFLYGEGSAPQGLRGIKDVQVCGRLWPGAILHTE